MGHSHFSDTALDYVVWEGGLGDQYLDTPRKGL